MNKIVVLCVAAAALTGCGGGSSGKKEACSPNATLNVNSAYVDKSEALDSEKKLTIRAGSGITEQTEVKLTLADGQSSVHKDKSVASAEDDSEMIIDFAKNIVTIDGQSASFARDAQLSAAKGRDVFVANEEQTKAAVQAATNADKGAGLKICSVSKAKMQFSYDPATNTVEVDEAYEVSAQLDAEIVEGVKSGKMGQEETLEEEVAE